jgi:uncharacterized protein
MHRLLLTMPAIAGVLAMTWVAGLRAGFLLLLGLGFGAALSGARFGFTTGWRSLLNDKDPWGMIGQMILMALCALLAFPLLNDFSDEIVGAVSPITWSLIIGSLVFGFAMQLADGCGSGTLYKAGASSPISWAVLPAFIFGSFLGAAHQPAWIALGGPLESLGLQDTAAPIDLIDELGLSLALITTLTICTVIALISLIMALVHARKRGSRLPEIPKRWLWGALAIALLYAGHLIVAGQPWGIVYGLGLWGAKIVALLGVDLSQNAFWGAAPHADRLVEPVLWDITSVTNIGLLYGALMASRWNNPQVKSIQWPKAGPLMISIAAGLLMGYSSRLAFGCNVGAYLGGVASGSLHGWIWFVFAFVGSIYGVKIRQKAGIV